MPQILDPLGIGAVRDAIEAECDSGAFLSFVLRFSSLYPLAKQTLSVVTIHKRFSVRAISQLALLLCGLIIATVGCRRSERPADLVIVNGQDPESLDPAIITGLEDYRAAPSIFEGLTRTDPKTAQAIPGLAHRWEILADATSYRFYLRDGLKWSTGEPITAEDVVYSWLRLLHPATAADYAAQLYCLRNGEAFSLGKISDPALVGVKAISPTIVEATLEKPLPYFLELCASPTLAIVPKHSIELHGDRWLTTPPVPTSGPYHLEAWRLNDKIRFRKNPDYWDASNTLNEIVDLLPVGSPTTAFNLYERGAVDIIWDKDLVPAELLTDLRQRKDFHDFQYIGTYFIRINVTRKPFQDSRVRQALALSLDKRRIVERIIRGGEAEANHLVPPGVANYMQPEVLPYDPEQARKLMSAAGYPAGHGFPPFKYLYDSAAGGAAKVHAKIAVELQEMWKRELGINMELKQLEKKVYLSAQSGLDYDLSRSSWIGDYNDPTTFLDLFLSNNGNNRTGWKHQRFEELMAQASVESNVKARSRILADAETVLVRDEAPIIPLYFYKGFQFYDPTKIEGIYGNILGMNPIRSIRRR